MRNRASRRRDRAAVVLVFGEDRTDTQSIINLAKGIRPDIATQFRPMREPISLTRDAGPLPVKNWLGDIERVVSAQEGGGQPVLASLVHQDADVVDARGDEEARLQKQLDASAPRRTLAVVPVVTIESWWLYHAHATEAIKPGAWKNALPKTNRNTDLISNPKSDLKTATRRKGTEYRETDGPAIADKIATGLFSAVGSSPSFERFRETVASL